VHKSGKKLGGGSTLVECGQQGEAKQRTSASNVKERANRIKEEIIGAAKKAQRGEKGAEDVLVPKMGWG